MSKLDDLLKVFRAGKQLQEESAKLNKQLENNRGEFVALLKIVSAHLNMDSNQHWTDYAIQDAWDLLTQMCERISKQDKHPANLGLEGE